MQVLTMASNESSDVVIFCVRNSSSARHPLFCGIHDASCFASNSVSSSVENVERNKNIQRENREIVNDDFSKCRMISVKNRIQQLLTVHSGKERYCGITFFCMSTRLVFIIASMTLIYERR